MITTSINPGFANNSFLVSKSIADKSAFLPFEHQVEFPVEVNGKHLIAKITGRIDIPVQWQILLEFNDGVTDMFYPPTEKVDAPWYASNKKNFAYSKAVSPLMMKQLNKCLMAGKKLSPQVQKIFDNHLHD